MTHSNFKDWIEGNIHIPDITETWSAYQTVSTENDYHPFNIGRNGTRLFLKKDGNDEALMISGEDAKQTFLKMLDYYYAEQGGVEMAKAVEHHNEKD